MYTKSKRFIFITLLVLIVAAFAVVPVLAQGAEPPIILPAITASWLALNIAAGMSLLFDYLPGLAAKYDLLSVSNKRLIALATAFGIVALVFGGTCAHIVSSDIVCSQTGAWNALSQVVLVFAVGQGIHAGTKPTPALKARMFHK
jgi:hypothetical protein